MIAPWLGLDASLSPAAGARIAGNLIQGTASVGISPEAAWAMPDGHYVSRSPVTALMTRSTSSSPREAERGRLMQARKDSAAAGKSPGLRPYLSR